MKTYFALNMYVIKNLISLWKYIVDVSHVVFDKLQGFAFSLQCRVLKYVQIWFEQCLCVFVHCVLRVCLTCVQCGCLFKFYDLGIYYQSCPATAAALVSGPLTPLALTSHAACVCPWSASLGVELHIKIRCATACVSSSARLAFK